MKKVGIVGCGIRGQLFARALRTLEGLKVIGMCDNSASARSAASEQFDGKIVNSYEDLYSLGLDAAIIATPDFAHRDAAIAAADAGLTMMVEKPLATSIEDARAVHDAVKTAGVECLVAFENRWNPHCVQVKNLLSSGGLGGALTMTGILSNSYFVPLKMLSWASASSPSWFLMPHIADLAVWFSGSRPTKVVAQGRRGELAKRGVDTWDSVHAIVAFENGALANLQSSWVLPDSRVGIVDFRFEVTGSLGSAEINANNQGLTTATDKPATPSLLPVEVDGQEESMAAWMARHFGKCVLSGEPLSPGVDHGLLITEIIASVHAAIESGTAQPVGE